jgi:hypothetical protein
VCIAMEADAATIRAFMADQNVDLIRPQRQQ